jgi:O-antigen ligase/tetratricopeptide (TPR) repeat protein
LERQFVRIVLLAVLVSGLLVATVGLLQQLTWNGKLLWFFVPYDWGAPRLEAFPRMSGPFVNPDHFANYLMLCFPLALVGTFSPHAFHLGQRPGSLQFFCGITACILFIGILFSRSRGGWLAMLFSVSVLLWEIRTLLRRKLFSWFGVGKIRAIILSMALLGGLWLFCLGTAGREQLVARVEETFKEDLSLRIRVTAWRGSLAIIQDFPVLGVGLGAWPELFPRYRPSPWLPLFYREAHNDYLELAAETGFLGCALLAWFFGQSARRLMKRLQSGVSSFSFSYLALLAACVGMAVHELVDANLQVPANALLFIVVFGLALRLTRARKREEMDLDPLSLGKQGWTLRPAAGVGMLSAVLLVITSTRESLSYSQNAPSPSSLTEARALILSHPTRSSAHLALARQLRERTSSARWLEELRIAVTLDQANPAIRDLYAWSLLQAGKENEGLEQISQAIFFSPKLSAHSYLATRMLPWLSAKEHAAVEAGFQQAVTLGIDEAALELGAFYHALNRFTEEGRLYEMMALRYSTPRAKAEAVLQAARAYALAGALEKAEELFRRGAELVPTDPGPYHYLALWIFAPRKDLRSAEQVITEGIRKGADPFSLSLSLAETAKKIGNLDAAEAAFLRALALRPSSYDARLKLGLLYLQQNLAERAALLLRQVTELNPHQAEPFYYLGLAEEARSEFSAAEQAYSRALTLAPGNIDFRNQYEALLKKISGHGMHAAIGEQLRRRMNQ